MVMDADNHVYPTALRKLADALRAQPDASAAYSVLEDFGAQRNVRSAVAWDPPRLCAANYIDAQAMWRKADWQSLGGYRAWLNLSGFMNPISPISDFRWAANP
jgi:hypothetical protein